MKYDVLVGHVKMKKEAQRRDIVKILVCPNQESSWDTIWKWEWFSRDFWKPIKREENMDGVLALHSHLSKLGIKSILDCSCGLGFKTILLAELGYEVEGSDASAIAVRYAPQLAKEEGLNIGFFRSRWEELGEEYKRKFDCVFSDAFDWITKRESLLASAKGIYSVLKKNGIFVFGVPIANSKNTKRELKKIMNKVWEKQGRFEILPPYERNGTKLTVVMVYDRVSDGIFENRIHLIEEKGHTRAEIAFMMDFYKWVWNDYTRVLREAGFRKVYGFEERGIGQNVAVK